MGVWIASVWKTAAYGKEQRNQSNIFVWKIWNRTRFSAEWTLIYFAFTHCPDICPYELLKLAAAINKIKEKTRIEMVPVFISVHPERDIVDQVHDYFKGAY
ncbi:Sco1-like protein [Thalictrum thalictroides]|uniref:Sco1-like protein n=1 Tax=Thalictrum thalictroides TaxID=46969 RepID=A0A7J6X5K2_THATH|nr:Sco1-like protein [Thalictrum thalictroides]